MGLSGLPRNQGSVSVAIDSESPRASYLAAIDKKDKDIRNLICLLSLTESCLLTAHKYT